MSVLITAGLQTNTTLARAVNLSYRTMSERTPFTVARRDRQEKIIFPQLSVRIARILLAQHTTCPKEDRTPTVRKEPIFTILRNIHCEISPR